MKYTDIARFLNISEESVRSLGNKKLLPGRASEEGWAVTFEELEKWYIEFTGKEWADLVFNGKIDPLLAEVDLGNKIKRGTLGSVLKSWESKGMLKIISHNPNVDPEVFVVSLEIAKDIEKEMEKLKNTTLPKYIRSQIEIAYQSENVIGRTPVVISLQGDNILKLSIENNLTELRQRDREMIRFYLAKYSLQLSDELKRNVNKEID